MVLSLSIFLILSIFVIVNINLSVDYNGYIEYFECSIVESCSNILAKRVEISYIYISKLFSFIGGENAGLYVVISYALVSIFIKLFVISRSSFFGVALFAYLVHGFFIHEMTQVRVGLSIAFFWLAVFYGEKERAGVSVLAMVAAYFFHNSAIVALAYYLFRKINLNKFMLLFLLVGSVVVGMLMPNIDLLSYGWIDNPRLIVYLSASADSIIVTPQFTANIIIYMLVLLFAAFDKGYKDYSKFEAVAFKLSVLGVILYLSFYWLPVIALRLMEMFTSFMPFVFSAVYKRNRSVAVRFVLVALIFGLFLNLFVRNDNPFSEDNEPVAFDVESVSGE